MSVYYWGEGITKGLIGPSRLYCSDQVPCGMLFENIGHVGRLMGAAVDTADGKHPA